MTAEDLLICQAVQGDGDAFDALVKPHQVRAYRTACLVVRDPDAAADALQEALLRAYKSLRNMQPGHPFYPWFARIVVNEALKQAKRRAAYTPLTDLVLHRAAAPDDLLQYQEDRDQLWRAIERLKPAHRAVIVLRYYEELSEAEMATVLEVPPGTVKSRLHHARAALEQALQRTRPVGQPTRSINAGRAKP